MLKLCGFPLSNYHNKAKLALLERGVPFEEVLVPGGALEHSPMGKVPYLLTDEGPLCESQAIVEYVEARWPNPPLLPADPRGRARVRGLAQMVACEGHPLLTPRVRKYLEHELKLDAAVRQEWPRHWIIETLKGLEGHLASDASTGQFCHGDTPTLADICMMFNVEDTHVVAYALKKLEGLKLISTGRRGKEKTVKVTSAGAEACRRYHEVREELLASSVKGMAFDEEDMSRVAALMRALSGQYDQAARAAASL